MDKEALKRMMGTGNIDREGVNDANQAVTQPEPPHEDDTAPSQEQPQEPKAPAKRRGSDDLSARRSVVMTEQEAKDLAALAALKGISSSELIRQLIRAELQENQEQIRRFNMVKSMQH